MRCKCFLYLEQLSTNTFVCKCCGKHLTKIKYFIRK